MPLPSAPSGVSVFSVINGLCIRVNWTPVDGASWYGVYRSEIPHDGFTQIGFSVPGITYYDNPQDTLNLNLRNSWYYQVDTTSTAGTGAKSGPFTYLPYEELTATNVPKPGLSYWGLLV